MDLTTAMVQQFSANLYTLAQQKGSKLRGLVSVEDMNSEKKFFDRVGSTVARQKTGKFEDSPIIETPFTRRMVVPKDYDWGDMLETTEKLRSIIEPTSAVVTAGSYALGRAMDELIISAATGSAWGGKDGTTEIILPSSQKVAVTIGNGGSGNVGLNVLKLIKAKSIFGKNDIDLDDPENALQLAVSQEQLDDLLEITEVKSADYNTVKALVEGKVDTFMGFKFVRTQLVAKSGNVRSCFAFCKSGIKLAIPQDISVEVAKRADKCFNWYGYAKMTIASTRIDDTKVVEIACEED